jgi:hypothetical protein
MTQPTNCVAELASSITDSAAAFCELCGVSFCLRHLRFRQDGSSVLPQCLTPWGHPAPGLHELTPEHAGLLGLRKHIRQNPGSCGPTCFRSAGRALPCAASGASTVLRCATRMVMARVLLLMIGGDGFQR